MPKQPDRLWHRQRTVLRIAKVGPTILIPPVLLGLMLSGLYVAQAWITSAVFTRLLEGRDYETIVRLIFALALVLLAIPLIGVAKAYLINRIGLRLKLNLRQAILHYIDERGPMRLSSKRAGMLESLMVDGVENIEPYYGSYLPQIIITTITVASLCIWIGTVSPLAGVVLFISAVATFLIPRIWDKVLAEKGQAHWDAYAELNADFIDAMSGMTTLKAFGAAEQFGKRLANRSQTLLNSTLTQLRISLGETGASAAMMVLGPAFALAITIMEVRQGSYPVSDLFFITLLSIEVFRPLRELANAFHAGYFGLAAADQIYSVLPSEQPSATRFKTSSASTTQPNTPQTNTPQTNTTQTGQFSTTQADNVPIGNTQTANTQTNTTKTETVPTDSAQTNTTKTSQFNTTKTDTAPTNSAQTNTTRVDTRQLNKGQSTEHPTTVELATLPSTAQATIAVRDLSYRYEQASHDALNGVSLEVAQGEFAVLVGSSGSGKSTLLGLLLGFDNPKSGEVSIGGIPTDQLNVVSTVSLVPQQPILFPGTVESMLKAANPQASTKDALRVLTLAQAFDFRTEGEIKQKKKEEVQESNCCSGQNASEERIQPPTNNSNSQSSEEVSKTTAKKQMASKEQTDSEQAQRADLSLVIEESAANISGGQKQRLAIARALIRNPRVLILDESTSALDSQVERTILTNLRTEYPEMTLILVTHRMDIAQLADTVTVLGKGRVVEQGPPEQLLANHQAFREMVANASTSTFDYDQALAKAAVVQDHNISSTADINDHNTTNSNQDPERTTTNHQQQTTNSNSNQDPNNTTANREHNATNTSNNQNLETINNNKGLDKVVNIPAEEEIKP